MKPVSRSGKPYRWCKEVASRVGLIEFSTDGTTLFATSSEIAWGWKHDVENATASNPRVVISGMGNSFDSHTTYIPLHPNLLIISRGSDGNVDISAASQEPGHAQVTTFDLNNVPDGGYDYTTLNGK